MVNAEDYSSDAPEGFPAEQRFQIDALTEPQLSGKRVTREGKERRRLWAQRKTERPPQNANPKEKPELPQMNNQDDNDASLARSGLLPVEIVNFLATREKQVFLLDSEEEKPEVEPTTRRKKAKGLGSGTVVLSDVLPPPCVQVIHRIDVISFADLFWSIATSAYPCRRGDRLPPVPCTIVEDG